MRRVRRGHQVAARLRRLAGGSCLPGLRTACEVGRSSLYGGSGVARSEAALSRAACASGHFGRVGAGRPSASDVSPRWASRSASSGACPREFRLAEPCGGTGAGPSRGSVLRRSESPKLAHPFSNATRARHHVARLYPSQPRKIVRWPVDSPTRGGNVGHGELHARGAGRFASAEKGEAGCQALTDLLVQGLQFRAGAGCLTVLPISSRSGTISLVRPGPGPAGSSAPACPAAPFPLAPGSKDPPQRSRHRVERHSERAGRARLARRPVPPRPRPADCGIPTPGCRNGGRTPRLRPRAE